jgi:hypothetical protein
MIKCREGVEVTGSEPEIAGRKPQRRPKKGDEMTTPIDEAREALEKYGRHGADCPLNPMVQYVRAATDTTECTCGLDTALSKLAGVKVEEWWRTETGDTMSGSSLFWSTDKGEVEWWHRQRRHAGNLIGPPERVLVLTEPDAGESK